MRYLSLFSGICAATVAWKPLGWEAAAFSQFDPEHKGRGLDFASSVLATRYPDVPNMGDVTKADFDAIGPVDAIVFGSPCQSFSVAGKRLGLDDARGNLALIGGQIVYRKRPRWFIFENVPGLLSSDSGWDFGTLLASFAGYPPGSVFSPPADGWKNTGYVTQAAGGYGLAWRVLDAQFCRVDGFGRAVPQRRRRVFVVGYLGDWRRAAAVLFERESLSGNPAPRRQPGQGTAADVAPSLVSSGRGVERAGETRGQDPVVAEMLVPDIAPTMSESSGHARPGDNIQSVGYLIPEVANPLPARMFKGVNTTMDEEQTMIGRAFSFKPSHFTRGKDGAPAEVFPPLSADADKGDQDALICEPMVFDETQITHPENRSVPRPGAPLHALASGARPPAIAFNARQDPIHSEIALPLDTHGSTQAIAFSQKDYGNDAGEVAPTLRAMGHSGSHANGGGQVAIAHEQALAFQPRFARNDRGAPSEVAYPLTAEAGRTGKGDSAQCVASGWVVRRLTPVECERLQGFPDGFTNIPWRGKDGAPDGPRYKALGNSMAVNVMRWLGTRMQMVDEIA